MINSEYLTLFATGLAVATAYLLAKQFTKQYDRGGGDAEAPEREAEIKPVTEGENDGSGQNLDLSIPRSRTTSVSSTDSVSSTGSSVRDDVEFVYAKDPVVASGTLSERKGLGEGALEHGQEISKSKDAFQKLISRLQGNIVDNFLRSTGVMKTSIEISKDETTETKINQEIVEINGKIDDMKTGYANDFAKRCEMYASQWPGSRTPRGVIFEDLKLLAENGFHSKAYILGKIDLLAKSFAQRVGDGAVNNAIKDLKTTVNALTTDEEKSLNAMNTQIDKYLNEKIGFRTPREAAINSLKTLLPGATTFTNKESPLEGPGGKGLGGV